MSNQKPVTDAAATTATPATDVVVMVRFELAGKPYNFAAPTDMGVKINDWVVINTSNGLQVGQVVAMKSPESDATEDLKRVLRLSTSLDMARYQTLQKRGERLVEVAQEEIKALKQKEVKTVSAKYTLDGEQATLLHTGRLSNEQRATLRRRLASRMKCRVNLRAVGPRDQAKALDGYGVCGEPRCCSRFLTKFQAVSIRMAKDQAISLAPTDITGMCGRLRCCIAYEHPVYKEASKDFPPRKAHVETPEGEGRVHDWDVLNKEVIVEIPPHGPRRERKRFRFALDEVKVIPHKKQ